MAWIATSGLIWPPRPRHTPGNSIPQLIDASTEKVAAYGRVRWDTTDRTVTKQISKVHFRIDGLTKAGGSAWTVSLQDVSLTASPAQPDGTQDQTGALSNAAAVNGWNIVTLASNRTVSFNDLLALVIEYNGGGRLGADALSLGVTQAIADQRQLLGGATLFTGSWTDAGGCPSVMLEFSDGSFGEIDGGLPISGNFANDYNSGSTNEQAGALFTAPYTAKVEGWMMQGQPSSNSADFDARLLDASNTLLASASYDANAIEVANANRNMEGLFNTEATIRAGQQYRLILLPTTVNNIRIRGDSINNATYLDAWPGGRNMTYTERDGAGAWAGNTTIRMYCSLRISAILDGSPRADLHPIEHGIAG